MDSHWNREREECENCDHGFHFRSPSFERKLMFAGPEMEIMNCLLTGAFSRTEYSRRAGTRGPESEKLAQFVSKLIPF